MTIYVDDARIPAEVPNGRYVHRGIWCHLMSDTSAAELCDFAESIGLKLSWLQDKPSGVHFDVNEHRRAMAVRHGAVELETRSEEWTRVVQAARAQHPVGPNGGRNAAHLLQRRLAEAEQRMARPKTVDMDEAWQIVTRPYGETE